MNIRSYGAAASNLGGACHKNVAQLVETEDVTMHKLPSRLLAGIFLVEVVVGEDVLVQGPHQDHRHHPGEEQDHQQGVDDREPVDLLRVYMARVRWLSLGDTPMR